MMSYNAKPMSSQQQNVGFGKQNFLKSISVFVPNAFTGAVIGKSGGYVKMLQDRTSTSIKVQPYYYSHSISYNACMAENVARQQDESGKEVVENAKNLDEYGAKVAMNAIDDAMATAVNSLDVNAQNDRGNFFSQYHYREDLSRLVNIEGKEDVNILRALFWIFQRVAEVKNSNVGLLQLHIEFKIPDQIVGNLIGKRGGNINELKRISMGCDVQVTSKKDGSEATVCLFGTFGPCLVVICRINCLREACLYHDGRRSYQSNNINRSIYNGASAPLFLSSTVHTPRSVMRS